MPRTATIERLPEAFEMIKQMRAEGLEWGEDYRPHAREAVAEMLEGRMHEAVDRHLERMSGGEGADRRNGFYRRWLLTELGRIELQVPRTRRFDPLEDMETLQGCWSTRLDPMAYGADDPRNARVVIDACKPWSRRETFPIVARTSQELEEKIRARWARDLPPGG